MSIRAWILLGLFVAMLVGLAGLGRPLGRDESIYVGGGRTLIGQPGSPYPIERPVGMRLVAVPAILAGGSDFAVAVTAIVTGLAFLGATWLFACWTYDRRTAAMTVVVVASSFVFVRGSIELLSDLPSGAMALLFAGLLIRGLESSDTASRWRLLWLGPLAAACFYLRYGEIMVLGALLASSLVVFRRHLRYAGLAVLVAMAVAAALLMPHFLESRATMGSPLGILTFIGEQTRGFPNRLQGLAFFVGRWWIWLGPAAGLCVAIGLVASGRRNRPATTTIGLASAIVIAVVAVHTRPQARYLLVPEAMLAAAGVQAIRSSKMLNPRLGVAIVAAAYVMAFGLTVRSVERARSFMRPVILAAAAVRRAAGGRACQVMGADSSQLGWYSGCRGDDTPPDIVAGHLREPSFFVRVDDETWRLADTRLAPMTWKGVRAEPIERIEGADEHSSGATVYRLTVAKHRP